MHIEAIKDVSAEDISNVVGQTAMFDDPPDGLRATVAWKWPDGTCSVIFVWDDVSDSAKWSQEVMWPKLSSGELSLQADPPETVEEVQLFLRDS